MSTSKVALPLKTSAHLFKSAPRASAPPRESANLFKVALRASAAQREPAQPPKAALKVSAPPHDSAEGQRTSPRQYRGPALKISAGGQRGPMHLSRGPAHPLREPAHLLKAALKVSAFLKSKAEGQRIPQCSAEDSAKISEGQRIFPRQR